MSERAKQEEYRANMQRECAGAEGQSFTVYILHARGNLLEYLEAKGKSGEHVMAAIIDWSKSVEAGQKETPPVLPVCACCDVIVGKGTVGGWIIMIPATTEKTAIGATAVFCGECGRLDQEALTQKIVRSIRNEYNAQVDIHAMH
jgi:TRAP-type uncharacterized transport system fused permease subunit